MRWVWITILLLAMFWFVPLAVLLRDESIIACGLLSVSGAHAVLVLSVELRGFAGPWGAARRQVQLRALTTVGIVVWLLSWLTTVLEFHAGVLWVLAVAPVLLSSLSAFMLAKREALTG